MNRPMIIYILGAGHCGSTILSLALDRHSDVLAVSEIVGLNAKQSGYAGDQDFRQHEFWSRVAESYEQDFGESFWNVKFSSSVRATSGSSCDWGKRNENVFSSIAKTAGKSLIVDASKQPRRLELLLQENTLNIGVIYLVRDARAIVHSYDRKYKSFWLGFRQVSRLDRRARGIGKRFSNVPWMTLRYEDLTEDFQRSIERVCVFCGISFQKSMLLPDTASFNGVGGNRLRLKPIEAITSDRSWEKAMPAWKRFFVSFLLAGYQRRLGYPFFGRTSRKGEIE